jgi:hypothetical protein
MTVDICLQACRGHGFRYAALHGTQDCFCATQFPNPGPGDTAPAGLSPGTPTPGSTNLNTTAPNECHVTPQSVFGCHGNLNEWCGSNTASDLYEDPSFSNASGIGVAANYQYLGCFANPNPGFYVQTHQNDTIDCMNYCGTLGYPFAARTYYDSSSQNQCGCGTEIQVGLQTDESVCNYQCAVGR